MFRHARLELLFFRLQHPGPLGPFVEITLSTRPDRTRLVHELLNQLFKRFIRLRQLVKGVSGLSRFVYELEELHHHLTASSLAEVVGSMSPQSESATEAESL